MARALCCGLWLALCVVFYGWSLCRSLFVELYDLAYGKSFVLQLMAGALCCSLWVELYDLAYG